MLFVEPRFLGFFVVVFALYWGVRGDLPRKIVLLIASYIFYMAWDWRFAGLILFSTTVDYAVARLIEAAPDRSTKRRYLLISLAMNLGVLGFFKYFNFFAQSLVGALNLAGVHADWTTLHIILPVGVSFFTFQSLSYTIDVYRGQLKARRSYLELALFIAFFPQLVAGPIVRAREFLPQFDEPRRFWMVRGRLCLALFLVGFVKKACISNNLGPLVDQVFANPGGYDGPSAIAGALLYAVQIYCDFSGYTDMAIALAGLLGYALTENFRWPYFAPNIADFWRRWHISLSSWLRDYLYIPLGGNRGSKLFSYRNLMLTMVLGGLWHGASINFLIWGFLHGLALILQREWTGLRQRGWVPRLGPALGVAMTFGWVTLAWVFFRAADLAAAGRLLNAMAAAPSPDRISLGVAPYAIFAALALAHWAFLRLDLAQLAERTPRLAYSLGAGAVAAAAFALVPVGARPFIYFQF